MREGGDGAEMEMKSIAALFFGVVARAREDHARGALRIVSARLVLYAERKCGRARGALGGQRMDVALQTP